MAVESAIPSFRVMIGSIIEIAIGYFVTYHVPGMAKIKKGALATIIRLIGILLIIGGFVSLARNVFSL